MISLDVDMQNLAPLASMISGLSSQIPYAVSVAINKTLDSAQAAIQAKLPTEFTLRRADFISRTIYIAPKDRAKKDNLVGTVRVNTARDFLAKFEDGGEKVSSQGKALAVPIMRLDGAPNLIIQRGDPLSVKFLMASIQDRGGTVLRLRGRKGQHRVVADKNKVYLVKSAKGTFILQRTSPTTSRVLYAFERSVPIKPDLHFDDTALAAALAAWPANVEAAIERAIETMR